MKKLNLIQKIKLINKISKAYKASKKLIDSKQGLAEETREVICDIRKDVQRLVKLLPAYGDIYVELEVIAKDAF